MVSPLMELKKDTDSKLNKHNYKLYRYKEITELGIVVGKKNEWGTEKAILSRQC